MAYVRVSTMTYNGADATADHADWEMVRKFKADAGLNSPEIITAMEAATGFSGWTLDKSSDTTVKHTATWESEADYDAFRADFGEEKFVSGADWEVDNLESAS